MNISYNWLKEYIDIDLSPEALAETLTDAGLEAMIIDQFPDYFKSIVVGKVLSKEKHPDADKLSVCMVDLGEGDPQQIICGAPNVDAGQKVPVATIGTTFPQGLTIKKAKLRGVFSHGMICSERELELSEDQSGIMVLDAGADLGIDMGTYLSGNDVSIELDLTPDRSDALGHIGVARDLAALLGKDLRIPELQLTESSELTADSVSVEILDADACPRYAARLVKSIKIGDSPMWIKQRLEAAGVRSINNVVDAANYVLMETGHPLHTFDLRYIEDNKIIVRRAETNEKITTLDGKERELDESVLLICDGKKPVAVAGIMGGENSEVKDDTTDLLLESAYFEPVTVRRGARKLQLSTDASHRFERGADPNGIPYALDRLAGLIVELAGGEITRGQVDANPKPINDLQVELRVSRCNMVLGTDLDRSEVIRILTGLGMSCAGSDTLQVTVPTFRPDITREIDLIEEVGRIYGYDNIPFPSHFRIANKPSKEGPDTLHEKIIDHLAATGFNQIYGNSLVKIEEHPILFGDEEPLLLENPISRDMASVRSSLLVGMVRAANYNINRRQADLKLFELGQVSTVDTNIDTGAREQTHVSILMSGDLSGKQWGHEARAADIYQMKGVVASLFKDLFKLDLIFKQEMHDLFGDSLSVLLDEKVIGVIAMLEGIGSSEFELPGIYAEMIIPDALMSATGIQYEKVSAFPSVERDLSILVDADVSYSQLEEVINQKAGKYLIYGHLYDIYEGKSIASGKISFTFRLVFQNQNRTLTEKEIDKDFKRILRGLEDAFNATLREAM